MKKLLLFTVISLLMFYQLVFAESNKIINFATEATYPPFEFIDESGQIQGFDIDIAKAICKKMNAECVFSNQAFSSLIPSLKLGKFDAVISALGITAERQKQVAFTHSYYQPSGSFIAAASKHYQMPDILDKVVGVQQGSTFETYLKDKYGRKITIKTYASIQEAFLDLTSGRVDIVLADTPIAKEWLKQQDKNKSYSIVDKPIVDAQYFGTGYGIAVRKDNTELLNAFNKALVDIKTDGTYANIEKQYFGTP